MSARAIVIPTRRRTLRARAARLFAIVWLRSRLRWAEQDRARLAFEVDSLPSRLQQMDLDLQTLRVQLAIEEHS